MCVFRRRRQFLRCDVGRFGSCRSQLSRQAKIGTPRPPLPRPIPEIPRIQATPDDDCRRRVHAAAGRRRAFPVTRTSALQFGSFLDCRPLQQSVLPDKVLRAKTAGADQIVQLSRRRRSILLIIDPVVPDGLLIGRTATRLTGQGRRFRWTVGQSGIGICRGRNNAAARARGT